LNTLAECHQVRRGKQSHPQACGSINALEHGTGRTFPIGAGNMDKMKPALWVSSQLREPEGVRQAELGAKPAKVIEELYGFRVGHWIEAVFKGRSATAGQGMAK